MLRSMISEIHIHWWFFFLKNLIWNTCHHFLPKLIQREIIIWQVTFENVYLLGSHSNRLVQPGNASKVCNVHISHEPLIWGKIDFFLPFCLMMRLLEKNSVTCIKIIMEFCWILFSHSRMMYMYMWLCFCMFHQPKVTYLFILKILLLINYR